MERTNRINYWEIYITSYNSSEKLNSTTIAAEFDFSLLVYYITSNESVNSKSVAKKICHTFRLANYHSGRQDPKVHKSMLNTFQKVKFLLHHLQGPDSRVGKQMWRSVFIFLNGQFQFNSVSTLLSITFFCYFNPFIRLCSTTSFFTPAKLKFNVMEAFLVTHRLFLSCDFWTSVQMNLNYSPNTEWGSKSQNHHVGRDSS